uniref:Retrotransposon, putative, centromere-specific n=1 Tax=Oryza sativa subsp. japonica TaxID=39947 RepID=Q5WMS4_ORYSJ|nr:hypothetical protein [Oryza sativa Japonica Group]
MTRLSKRTGDRHAQHGYLHRDMRSDQHDQYEEVHNHEMEDRDMKEPPVPLFTLKVKAPPSYEEGIKGKLNGAEIIQEELCDNASLISMPQLVNEHAISNVVLNRPRNEHHMEKPRTIFHEEGEDDVTLAATDTTIAHIIDEQEDIKIKSSKCCNPIRPPATLLTSNGRRICIRPPFSAHEYLMESSRSPLSNRSSLIAKFLVVWLQSHKQGATSRVLGLWACNFVWDPGPSGPMWGAPQPGGEQPLASLGRPPTPINRNRVDLHRQDQQPTERCIDH